MSKEFPNTGKDFSGYDAATKWLKENGYSYGSMQRGAPTAIFKGDCDVSKWRNLRQRDIDESAGMIMCNSPMTDKATIILKDGAA